MKRFMNALLTTTLLTLPSAFAADAFVSDVEGKNECETLVPVTNTAAQGTRTLKDIPFEVWSNIPLYLDGKNIHRFRRVSKIARNCVPMAMIAQAKVISGIPQFKSFPDTKTIGFLPLHALVIEIFSQLMHENKILDVSGNLTLAGIEFSKIIDSLNIPMLIPISRFTETARKIHPKLILLLLTKAHAGSIDAQDLVAKGYAYGWHGFTQTPTELLELANIGWLKAQDLVAYGYSLGECGLPHSPDTLLELANKGWEKAQDLVAEGYAGVICGLPKSLKNLLKLANKDWPNARRLVAEGYAEAKFGFTQNPRELLGCADKGWTWAQYFVADGYAEGKYGFTQNSDTLLDLANNGWKHAQKLVAEGYAKGQYGLPQSTDKLLDCANKGWPEAQCFVVEGYAKGKYGLPQNPTELLDLANNGWSEAQCLVVQGYAKGNYGFTKNPILGELLTHYYQKLHNDLNNAPLTIESPAATAAAADSAD